MRRRNKKGFTLVEIMIVVAIIALLAAIAIPNLLRARLSANDALAQSTLRAISTAAETWGTAHNGDYPPSANSLTAAQPAYLNNNYCNGSAWSGFTYDCSGMNGTSAYTVTATPSVLNTTGSASWTISTGGILVQNP